MFECGSTNVARLSNHLAQVLVYLGWILQNKKRLMWSKIRISAPLEDKDEKDINMANMTKFVLIHPASLPATHDHSIANKQQGHSAVQHVSLFLCN